MFGLLALLLVVSPPHFRATPAWQVGSSHSRPCVGTSASRCVWAAGWASTVRYRDCPNCVAPHRTLAHLPPKGIVIQLMKTRERPPHMQTGSWPPGIRRQDVHPGFEGVQDLVVVARPLVGRESPDRGRFAAHGQSIARKVLD